MRLLKKFVWAGVVGLAMTGTATAQQTGGGGATSGGGGATGGGGSGTTQTFLTASSLDSTIGAAASNSNLNSSNIFSRYYANPLYQGRAGAAAGENPGGFGAATYTTSGAGGARAGGTTGARTAGTTGTTGARTTGTTGGLGTAGLGATTGLGGGTGLGGTTGLGGGGRAGGLGGTTGFGGAAGGLGGTTGFGGRAGGTTGFGGLANGLGTQNASQVIQQPRAIAYTSQLRFTPPPMTASRMQTDVRAVLDRSSSITNARGITVQSDGVIVVLSGSVKDEDEARLVEGMVRLTPGVRDVRNDLKYPGSTP